MSLSRRFGLFTLAATVTFSTAVFAAPTFINILTGGTSGVYYPIGVGLSQIYGHDIQGAKTSVQATKASVENLNLLQAGRGELALALGDSGRRRLERGRRRLQGAVEEAAGYRQYLSELYPGSGQPSLGHQDPGRPERQAHFGGRAQERYRAERPGDLQGRRPELRGHGQGGVPALRRVGGADQEPPARRYAAILRPGHGGHPRPGLDHADHLRRDPGGRGGEDRQPGLPRREHSRRHLRRPGAGRADGGDRQYPGQPPGSATSWPTR